MHFSIEEVPPNHAAIHVVLHVVLHCTITCLYPIMVRLIVPAFSCGSAADVCFSFLFHLHVCMVMQANPA